MNQSKEIKAFLFSQYFSDGLRITLGVLLPSLLCAQVDQLAMGVTISLGAFCASMADSPGPITHKRNGMIACNIFVFLTALLTGLINNSQILIGLEIVILAFGCSMLTIYGSRASSIGTAALLVLILTMDHPQSVNAAFVYALYILIGGLWYMSLSLLVSQIRPYRLAQQALGEGIKEIATYMRLKALFYDTQSNDDANYKKIVRQQAIVHQHQDILRELLFKSDLMVKESTPTGRRLTLIFIDMVDLFEQMMATHYDYQMLKEQYAHTKVLAAFKQSIIKLTHELENLSYRIIQNDKPIPLHHIQSNLETLKDAVDSVETDFGLNNLVLKKILINIRNISRRIEKTYSYFDQQELISSSLNDDLYKFVSNENFGLKAFKSNLNFDSNIFRYALRMSLVCLIGYIVSDLLPLGHHSYWILLTILVILKPDFGSTKERNYQRLIGTLVGGIIGACFIIYIKSQTILFAILIFCMIGAYSFQRLNYIVSVLLLTPYILILFSFLGANTLHTLQERVIDTFVGSMIALVASYFVLPNWEYNRLNKFLKEALIANYNYLTKVVENLTGQPMDVITYKLVRKAVYVSAANMGNALQRMLSEPKSKQRNTDELHQFVVLNHMLSSYVSTLIHSTKQIDPTLVHATHIKLTKKSLYVLGEIIYLFDPAPLIEADRNTSSINQSALEAESHDSKILTEQLELVNKVVNDLAKISQQLAPKISAIK